MDLSEAAKVPISVQYDIWQRWTILRVNCLELKVCLDTKARLYEGDCFVQTNMFCFNPKAWVGLLLGKHKRFFTPASKLFKHNIHLYSGLSAMFIFFWLTYFKYPPPVLFTSS